MKNYTTQQVADILLLETETIREYIRQGKLKAFKVGKEWRVSEESLKVFIEERNNI